MLIYEDDGVGIPQDKKELIFERGFTTSSDSIKSSGLGLFLARDILAITGITIKETGAPGIGSRFEMIIPPGKWRCGPAE
jgi:signal transduction histidine kinase